MTPAVKRIGVLTGGGDCPGLNAVIRAVVKTAIYNYGIEVIGIEDGYQGLVENRMRPLSALDVSGILTIGGTILGTSNKCDPKRVAVGFDESGDPRFEDRTEQCIDHIRKREIEALVLIGGDGTMAGSEPFLNAGVPCVGVPKTIDNDLEGTDLTFGFMTAVNTATDAIDRLHTTAMSHHRVMVVEVMGRNAGWIALHAGVASGSDVILIPEIPYALESICTFIHKRSRAGKRFSIACIAEGATPLGGAQVVSRIDPTSPDPIRLGGIGARLADDIERCIDQETRATNLGHVIRGGSPIAADRVLATRFGHCAMQLLAKGSFNRLVAMQKGEITDIDIFETVGKQRKVPLDCDIMTAARSVGTCFGD